MVDTFSSFYDTIYSIMLKFIDAAVSFWNTIVNTDIETWCEDNLNVLEGLPIFEWVGEFIVDRLVDLLDVFNIADLSIFEFLLFGFVTVMVALFIIRLVF